MSYPEFDHNSQNLLTCALIKDFEAELVVHCTTPNVPDKEKILIEDVSKIDVDAQIEAAKDSFKFFEEQRKIYKLRGILKDIDVGRI